MQLTNAVGLQSHSTISAGNFEATLAPTEDHEDEVVQSNPEFASTMTLNHWKLYNPDETLDMYQKAEYLYHKD
jgi:hypothetical protein